MNLQQLISTIVVFLGTPAIIVYGFYAMRLIEQKYPERTASHLEQFALMAVRKVQQQYPNEEKTRKKTLAIQTVKTLFEAYPPLEAPSDIAIDIAIEAAVFLLPKE